MRRRASFRIGSWIGSGVRGRGAFGIALAVGLAASSILHAGAALAQGRPAVKLPSPALARSIDAAVELWRQNDFAGAVAAYERVLAATRAELGDDHEQTAIQAYSLGLVAEAAGRLDIAERAFRENVAAGEKVYGRDHAAITQGLQKLAEVLIAQGRPGDAEVFLKRSLAILGGILGADHSFTSSTHAGLGAVHLARGDANAALESYRVAVRLLTEKPETQTLARHVMDNEVRRQIGTFTGLVDAAWLAQRAGGAVDRLAEESYAASQRSWTTSAASALARMSSRLAAGGSELGKRIRKQQDAAERVIALHQEDSRELARWSAVQRADPAYSAVLAEFVQASTAQNRDNAPFVKRQTELVAALQAHLAKCPPGQKKSGCEKAIAERDQITKELGELSQQTSRHAGDIMEVHRRMEAAEAKLPGHAAFTAARKARIDEQVRLEREVTAERKAIVAAFPDYVALTEPQPLTQAETARALGPDEALVTLLVGTKASYVWAVSRERSAWARIDAGRAALAEHVTALRQGLDPLASVPGSAMPAFDLARAHALYRLLLAPVQTVIRGKSRLVLVPTGPLTSLPFQVLVTEPPAAGLAQAEALKRASWLVRSHATAVLPSVPSLAALRRVGAELKAAEPFLGVGDPVLNGPSAPAASGQSRAGATALAAVYRNGVADLRALRDLVPLPETAAELRAIASALDVSEDKLLLGQAATETRLKQTPLDRFRILHFATHGLVSGELSGLAEPALVLTPPFRASETDDGLLTASEVAGLRLGADWVVLSACNTAAGSDVGADALSGLARAFFFAGARALLVSHWAVNSAATVWLTTETFKRLAAEPQLGRAEAFRRTMLSMIDAGQPPSSWAPFVIVGEGSERRR